MATKGINAQIYLTGSPISIGTESLSVISGSGGKLWQIDNNAKDIWDPRTDITVEVNGSEVTTGFTLYYLLGRIKFDTDQSGNTIEVTSGKYFPTYKIKEATSLDASISVNTEEPTVFEDDGTRSEALLDQFTADYEHLDSGQSKIDHTQGSPTEETYLETLRNNTLVAFEYAFDTSVSEPQPGVRSLGYVWSYANNSQTEALLRSDATFRSTILDADANNPNKAKSYRAR